MTAVYAGVAALVFASGLPIVNLVVIAEPFLVLSAATAGSGLSLTVLWLVAVTASVSGDVVSYALGRHCGGPLVGKLKRRTVRRRLAAAQMSVRRRGMLSVVVQRWVPPVRGITTAFVGGGRLPCRRMLVYAVAAGVLWAGPIILGTYFGGVTTMLVLTAVLGLVPVVFSGGAAALGRRGTRRHPS